MEENELTGLVQRLALVRAQIATNQQQATRLEAELLETEIGEALRDTNAALRELNVAEHELVGMIHTAAKEVYRETADKKPHPAVGIRVYTVLEYAAAELVPWAEENLPEAVKKSLDKTAFERYATAMKELRPVPGVTFIEDPRVTIAGNLVAFLPQDPDTDEDLPLPF